MYFLSGKIGFVAEIVVVLLTSRILNSIEQHGRSGRNGRLSINSGRGCCVESGSLYEIKEGMESNALKVEVQEAAATQDEIEPTQQNETNGCVQSEPSGDSITQSNNNEKEKNKDTNASKDSETDAKHSSDNNGQQKISKNQLKKKRRLERMLEVKKRRKQQEKDAKVLKAKHEGRDIEAERKFMEERRLQGDGWAKRNKIWHERFQKQSNAYELCLDCSFEEAMTPKEVNSLAQQIRYCYASNRRATHPSPVKVTSLGGATLAHLQNVAGFDQWKHRAFEYTEKSILDAYPDKSKLCYLTSDSDTVLKDLEDGKVYIIGGIVDRNRLQRAAINRAEELGIATAKLPISDYLSMVTTKVLTCNHVFEILLKYRLHEKDWKKAFLDVLPHRKDVVPKVDKDS